uniref:Uncharacterized protein n=1 Tax=Timema genevievae TaxID=629358 RepID=A0A7R9JZN2_TIMGE|nr:unnamed protein product [Timema genevievae]
MYRVRGNNPHSREEQRVGFSQTQYNKANDQLESSAQALTMQLFPSHFSGSHLVLRCTSYIGTLYRQTAEVRLDNRGRDPVPERVTSPNSSSRGTALIGLVLLTLCCQNLSTKQNLSNKQNLSTKQNLPTKQSLSTKQSLPTKQNLSTKQSLPTKQNLSTKQSLFTNICDHSSVLFTGD